MLTMRRGLLTPVPEEPNGDAEPPHVETDNYGFPAPVGEGQEQLGQDLRKRGDAPTDLSIYEDEAAEID